MKKSASNIAINKKKSTDSEFNAKIKRAVDLLSVNPVDALVLVDELIKKDEGNPLLWVISGRANEKQGKFFDAEECMNNALELFPDYNEALYGKASLYYARDRLTDAELFLQDAIPRLSHEESRPLRSLMATILMKQKKFQQAMASFEELTREDPGNWLYWNNLAMIYQDLAEFEKMDSAYAKSCRLAKDNPTAYFNAIVGAHYNPLATAEQLLELCHNWQDVFKPQNPVKRAVAKNTAKNKKLRIGMISDGFRSHPVGNMITIGLSHIPASQMEFYAYSTNFSEDHITHRIQSICKKWQVIIGLTDEVLDKTIREDEIDILFDLCGYNSNSKMTVLQKAPAPLIIKWVGGLISSTGLKTMDYLLSDHVETPEGSDALYTEKLIRLPGDYICYDPPYYLPALSEPPFKKNGYITFGCFNNASKINDLLLEQWAVLLNNVPESRLLLKSFNFNNESLREKILTKMESHGITRDRMIIEGASPHKELLATYNKIDIALDPWPYSGGLTTCEAMAMGVPVVTLPGPTFAGRHSASHLVHAGMPELVADSWQQYIDIATGIANDTESLTTIRQLLRNILLASPVCDGQRFAQHFSDAMRAIWQRYCDGKAPEALYMREGEQAYFSDDSVPLVLEHPEDDGSATVTRNNDGFEFKLKGKVLMMDYGGMFVRSNSFIDLFATGAFHSVIMDTLGEVEENHLPLDRKSVQHIKMHVLGNGEDTPVYMCLDSRYSSDLKALAVECAAGDWAGQRVITEIKAPSSKLDEIHGLDRLEWFVVDNRFNLRTMFQYASRIMGSCLVLAVNYRFETTHHGQMRFDEIIETLAQYGFTFHAFSGVNYGAPVLVEGRDPLPSSKMTSAQLLFVPDAKRLATLSFEQREKLAFILHTAYDIRDLAYTILAIDSKERANIYASEAISVHVNTPANANRPKRHSLPQNLIVSLTSYHKRFKTLHLTLGCLVKQSVKADRIVLWIAESERALVPENVLAFSSQGVEIKYCDDLKSYKKIVPTLAEDPNAFIVTADDDLSYQPDWLEKLIAAWDGNYKTAVAYRAHKIILGKDSMPIPYNKWDWQYAKSSERSGLIFPTTGFGTLYPPHCFHHDVINNRIFEKLSPNTDDIWLYWMCRLNDVEFKVVGGKFHIGEWEGTSEDALWRSNLLKGENDKNIKNMISHYGFIGEKKDRADDEVLTVNNIFSFAHADKMVCMYLPNEFDHIQNLIKGSHGFYEPEMLADIAGRTKAGSAIIDIGANIGNHSVYFGLFCGAGKVLSFEPQSEVHNTLSRNISLNFLNDKVTAHQMGLGSYETTAKLGAVDQKNIGMTKLEVTESGGIKISTLDSMVENEPQNSISVIKIDVEGMEMEVLRGAVKTLERHSPVIYAEAATQPEFDEISEFLAKFSYVATKRFNATATYLFEKRK